jgi:phenylalanyl-tRNA synthetase beta chain
MKFSESWLREWVNPRLSTTELCDRLTMAGLEIEACVPAAGAFTDVVVGEVKSVTKHPEADRLNVCEVDIGGSALLQIVCGASNVRVGLRAPVAKVGAVLPGITIKAAKLRGVESQGMLCSASELGLAEESEGLLPLPDDAPIGQDFRAYYLLDDNILEVAITPNRGDCLSIQGMAREVSALTKTHAVQLEVNSLASSPEVPAPSVKLTAKAACPHYLVHRIQGVNANAPTPVYMKERLRRAGVRSINCIVDVTNYVMLELGQPMHAFDADKITGGIEVRFAKNGEKISLLDGSEKILTDATLVIADEASPLAIAGVMGGMPSSVTLTTTNILLESAYFSPKIIAKQRQHYQLNSDSAYRFERGVDPTLQHLAIERATDLIVAIAGGKISAMTTALSDVDLPPMKSIFLSESLLETVLGMRLAPETVVGVFKALLFPAVKRDNGWTVNVPPYRSDISIPEDLVEEVARIHGYEYIPMLAMPLSVPSAPVNDQGVFLNAVRQHFSDAGLHEVVSYSFVEPELQQRLNPGVEPQALQNPMTAEMAVMRTSLWPGLLNTLRYNQSRQQARVRLFEAGTVFLQTDDGLIQPTRVAGLLAGDAYPLQWGQASRAVDFYDLKGVLEGCFQALRPSDTFTFQPEVHETLHPGQSAGIYLNNVRLGCLGALHPALKQALDISSNVYLFELELDKFSTKNIVQAQAISKFPEIRRDLALVTKETIPAAAIQDTIKSVAGDWLKTGFVFDVYQGKGVAPGHKSIAVALYLQHPTRTLVDDEVNALLARVMTALKDQLGVELRS